MGRKKRVHAGPPRKKKNPEKGTGETKILKSPGRLLPEQAEVVLTYSTTYDMTAASPYFAYPFISNGPYDVDPALGSTATIGLSEMSAFYNGMRVLGYSGTVDVLSTGQYPSQAFVYHATSDLGITAGGANFDLEPYIGNPHFQRFMLGHSYSPQGKHTFTFKKTIAQIYGGPEPYTDDKFASSVATVPSAKTYLIVGAHAYGANLLSSPIRFVVVVRFRTRFFQRKALNI